MTFDRETNRIIYDSKAISKMAAFRQAQLDALIDLLPQKAEGLARYCSYVADNITESCIDLLAEDSSTWHLASDNYKNYLSEEVLMTLLTIAYEKAKFCGDKNNIPPIVLQRSGRRGPELDFKDIINKTSIHGTLSHGQLMKLTFLPHRDLMDEPEAYLRSSCPRVDCMIVDEEGHHTMGEYTKVHKELKYCSAKDLFKSFHETDPNIIKPDEHPYSEDFI